MCSYLPGLCVRTSPVERLECVWTSPVECVRTSPVAAEPSERPVILPTQRWMTSSILARSEAFDLTHR
jgi:hypothetical protein